VKSKANVMVLRSDNQGAPRLDHLKWVVSAVLLVAAVVGNYYYSAVSMPIRVAAWLVILAAAGFVASRTQSGKWVVEFFRDSRLEMRKVVWPTREETTQSTMVVAVMVVVLSILLWGMDSVLVWLIGWLTGQRG
jgi:preprotein translocase subunit SecE